MKDAFDIIYIFSPTYAFDDKWRAVPKKKVKHFAKYSDAILGGLLKGMDEKNIVRVRQGKRKLRPLFLFDDCGAEGIKHINQDNPFDRMIILARHLNYSVIISAQKMTMVSPNTRINQDVVMLFPSTNKIQLDSIYAEYGFGTPNSFRATLEYVWEEPYSFFTIVTQGPKTRYYKNVNSEIHFRSERRAIRTHAPTA